MQPKLTLGPANDQYEEEADRIADEVVSGGPAVQPKRATPLVQRMEGAEEEEELEAKRDSVQRMEGVEEEEELQAKRDSVQRMEGMEEEEELQAKPATAPRGPGPAPLGAAAAAVSGPGRVLSLTERSYFEPRFGADLGHVRLHTDSEAARAARGINARAFTLRNNIAFAPGELNAETTEGRRLLAHEITHTFQQGAVLRRRSIFAEIAGLFRGDRFSEDELRAYLQTLETTGEIEDYTVSDNKARAVTERIESGADLFGFEDSVGLRKLLIREMLSGATLGGDESAILSLLTSLDVLRITQLFEGENALDPARLRDKINGQNRAKLDRFFANIGLRVPGMQAPGNNRDCSDAEGEAIDEAKQFSNRDISRTIEILETAPASAQVRNAFFLAFRETDPAGGTVSDMIARLAAVRAGVATVRYFCDHGEETNSTCHNGAGGYVDQVGPGGRGVTICFMPEASGGKNLLLSSTTSASNLVTHEAAHFFLGVDDNGYFDTNCGETPRAISCLNGTRQNCGTSGRGTADRYDNADSHACFVYYLSHLARMSEEDHDAAGLDSLDALADAYGGAGLRLALRYPGDFMGEDTLHQEIFVNEAPGAELIVAYGEPYASGFDLQWEVTSDGEPLTFVRTTHGEREAIALTADAKSRLRARADDADARAVIRLRAVPFDNAPASSHVTQTIEVRLTTDDLELGL